MCEVNWTAVSSLATLAAVLVALWPNFRDWLQRKRQARNLRSRLLTQFVRLRPTIARRFINTPIGQRTDEALSILESEPIRAIEAMMPQAVILSAREHDNVLVAYINLMALVSLPRIEEQNAKDVLDVVDQAIAELQKGKWLQGKMPKAPWPNQKEKGYV